MKNKIIRAFLAGILVIGVLWFSFAFLPSKHIAPILMYHNIDNGADLLSISPEEFDRHLMFLKNHHYNVIGLAELVDSIIYKKKLAPKTVVITFDDGKDNNFTNAYPILKKYNMPATIFVIAGDVNRKGTITAAQIKQMYDSGIIDIGSHTMSHAWLPGRSDKELAEEITGSKKILEGIIKKKVNFISYPLGGFDHRARLAVIKAGYLGACATTPGRRIANNDIYALKRVKVSGKAGGNMFKFWFAATGYHVWHKELKKG